jgi:DUF2971 family protein
MPITRFKNISSSELDKVVWRYLTFPKYISLLSYGALWFSKLNILQDKYEGILPKLIDAEMRAEHEKYKQHFDPSMHKQIDEMNDCNVRDGKELTVASCWFAADTESERMWREYARDAEGLAIKSSIRSISQYVNCDPQISEIGKVKYVDLSTYSMSAYEANQAHERAFLKSLEYEHEQEVRIVTMSVRGPMCVGMDGALLGEEDWKGAGMNNFDNPGLYIQANLRGLIHSTVLAPGATRWFELMIKHIAQRGGLGPVERSSLDKPVSQLQAKDSRQSLS